MKGIKRIILALILIMVLTAVFTLLNYTSVIQPIIFALSATVNILYRTYTKLLLIVSLSLLSLMIIAYLFNQLNFSNWIGSLGFGLFIITIFSYLIELIKKGYIEKY